MKKIIFIISFLMLAIWVSSCKDLLDQPPKDQLDTESFFNTAKDLEVAVHDLYAALPGDEIYRQEYKSDNIASSNSISRVVGTRTVPTGKSSGGWSWNQLRKINYILANYDRVEDERAKEKYSGITKWFRAYFYYNKIKRFGDVPWHNKVLDVDDEALYKARDPRKLVMDSVLADLDYAIENIPAEKQLNKITKYTALALKARITLFEGTFRKYHGLGDYEKMLNEAVSASKKLIDSNAYELFTEGGKDKAYRKLFTLDTQDETETILAVGYNKTNRTHSFSARLIKSTWDQFGLTKDLVNSYLMTDGSRFTDKPDYKTIGFYEEMQDRDPRLTQTTAGPHFKVLGEDSIEPVDLSAAKSGYRLIKGLGSKDLWNDNADITDIILFRYAELLLIYAEAKSELGSITQEDLDISINKLRDRVGMPHLILDEANANPDPYQESMYRNIETGPNKGVILEIRRERRVELVNEGHRWWDLMRWKEGKKVEHPMVGIYYPHLGAYDFSGDGEPDVYVYDGDDSGAPTTVTSKINIQTRPLRDPITGEIGGTSGNIIHELDGKFKEPRDYYYPIPIEALELNDKLEQNPGW